MFKTPRTSIRQRDDVALSNIWRRELGDIATTGFSRRLVASEDFVLRLEIDKKLERHRGCVNTVSFNAGGDILVSGSDDKRVILWDWESGRVKLSFLSGHYNNVFQAKIMPHTSDRSIVTCAADGQVRHVQISEHGPETSLLGEHQGRAHKLAVEPESSYVFYSCGEDGVVQHFDLRTAAATKLFTCQPVGSRRSYMPAVHLNAIVIDPRNPNLFAVAGSDEYTRLYDIRRCQWDGSSEFGRPAEFFCPPHLVGEEHVGITGLAFSDQSELLVSYTDEFIYLMNRDMSLGPSPGDNLNRMKSPLSPSANVSDAGAESCSGESTSSGHVNGTVAPQVYKGHRNCETVKGVSFFGPKSEFVVSGSDCGRIFIWRKKDGELICLLKADKHVVNCIESHPHITALASSGLENDIKIWTPKALEKATLPTNIEQPRPKPRGWMYSITSPDDLLLQLYSLQRRRAGTERNGENSDASRDLLDLILTFNANSDDGFDDDDDEDMPSPSQDFFG